MPACPTLPRRNPTQLQSPMTLNRIRELSRRTARSVTEWGSPTDREEVFSWQHLAPCESVLDVACGNGSFIAKRPAGVTGLDIDEENIARCRAQGFSAVVGNALDLPYPDASFDGVHSAHVLFALQTRAAVQYLNELVRVTRPGGIIAISSLCDVQEVFDYPEVARPYPPQAIFRMIRKPDTNVGAEVRGVSYKAISFRRQPLINFRFSSLTLWRVASCSTPCSTDFSCASIGSTAATRSSSRNRPLLARSAHHSKSSRPSNSKPTTPPQSAKRVDPADSATVW